MIVFIWQLKYTEEKKWCTIWCFSVIGTVALWSSMQIFFSPVATDLQLNYNQIPPKVEVGENDELKLYIEKCYH